MAVDAPRLGARSLPPPPRTSLLAPRRLVLFAVLAVVVAAHVQAWRETGSSIGALVDGYRGTLSFLDEALPPDLDWDTVLRPSISAALVTLYTALLGTTLAVPGALLVGSLAARNVTPNAATYHVARSILSFLRAVPDVVFALVFVTAVGLGPFPGVLALWLHSIGVLGKLFAESIEETDLGPVDALRVGGASRTQVLAHAVLPAVTPNFVGLTLYRFDVNLRSSLVLGLVGAGGIGFLINTSIKLFRFDEMATHIGVVLVMVVAVDLLSAGVRKRLA